MNAKINNVIYMELYSGAKMVDDKYEKTNIAGSIDQEFTVLVQQIQNAKKFKCQVLQPSRTNVTAMYSA
jgi:hypothetical protein